MTREWDGRVTLGSRKGRKRGEKVVRRQLPGGKFVSHSGIIPSPLSQDQQPNTQCHPLIGASESQLLLPHCHQPNLLSVGCAYDSLAQREVIPT